MLAGWKVIRSEGGAPIISLVFLYSFRIYLTVFPANVISDSGAVVSNHEAETMMTLASLFCHVTTSVIDKHDEGDHVRKMY